MIDKRKKNFSNEKKRHSYNNSPPLIVRQPVSQSRAFNVTRDIHTHTHGKKKEGQRVIYSSIERIVEPPDEPSSIDQ